MPDHVAARREANEALQAQLDSLDVKLAVAEDLRLLAEAERDAARADLARLLTDYDELCAIKSRLEAALDRIYRRASPSTGGDTASQANHTRDALSEAGSDEGPASPGVDGWPV